MTLLRVALPADSIGQGTVGSHDIPQGGSGSYAELDGDRLANIAGVGPLLGPGFRGIWNLEWSSSGSWTKTISTDAFDKGLGGFAYYSAAGATATRTWTKPTQWRPIVGFCIEYIDYTSAGDPQYRIDGGTWTNFGQTVQNNNAYKRFYVAAAVTSTIDFRAYNGSTAAGICLTGIEPFYIDPRGANGVIVDNLGIAGIDLHDVALSTSGDRLARFDSVVLGTGSPPTTQPSIVIIGPYSNDVSDVNNSTTWAADLTTLRNRVAPFAAVGFINVYEQGSSRNTTTQASYRAQTKTTAAAFTPAAPVLDFFDQWTALGVGTFAQALNAGLLDTGSVHPSQAGYFDLADRVYWWIRQQFFDIGGGNAFRVGQSALGSTGVLGGAGNWTPGERATETDTANPATIVTTVTCARATETDTANAGMATGTAACARATEADSGNPLGTLSSTVAAAKATETDTANAATTSGTVLGAQATEADTASSCSMMASAAGSQSSETDTAHSSAATTSTMGAQAEETDSANAATIVTTVTCAQALETDAAFSGDVQLPGATLCAQALEADTAPPCTVFTVVLCAKATETDTGTGGLAIFTVTMAQATELSTALAHVPRVTITGGLAIEIDTANSLRSTGPNDVGDYFAGALASSWSASELTSGWQAGHITE